MGPLLGLALLSWCSEEGLDPGLLLCQPPPQMCCHLLIWRWLEKEGFNLPACTLLLLGTQQEH